MESTAPQKMKAPETPPWWHQLPLVLYEPAPTTIAAPQQATSATSEQSAEPTQQLVDYPEQPVPTGHYWHYHHPNHSALMQAIAASHAEAAAAAAAVHSTFGHSMFYHGQAGAAEAGMAPLFAHHSPLPGEFVHEEAPITPPPPPSPELQLVAAEQPPAVRYYSRTESYQSTVTYWY